MQRAGFAPDLTGVVPAYDSGEFGLESVNDFPKAAQEVSSRAKSSGVPGPNPMLSPSDRVHVQSAR